MDRREVRVDYLVEKAKKPRGLHENIREINPGDSNVWVLAVQLQKY